MASLFSLVPEMSGTHVQR